MVRVCLLIVALATAIANAQDARIAEIEKASVLSVCRMEVPRAVIVKRTF